MPPSQVVSFPPLKGVVPRLGTVVGGEDDDGVVGLPHVVDLLEHEANVSSICFMPASLTPQSILGHALLPGI